jgi:hypothetical protein
METILFSVWLVLCIILLAPMVKGFIDTMKG